LQGDLKKARRLAGQTARKAVLYTCDYPLPCPQEGPDRGESPAFPDPFDVLNLEFDGDLADQPPSGNVAHFDDSMYNRRLQAAARLSGAQRYRAYDRLDADLVRDAAP